MQLENIQQNIHNFEGFNAVANFPVKNMEILEYPSDEKKAQTVNFPQYQQNEVLKSSDSSFITGQ